MDPAARVLLRRFRDLRPPLGLPISRRISPDTANGGLGICTPARAVWPDLLHQRSAARHIIAAFRRAPSCGDRLWVDQDPHAVLARRIARPAERNLSDAGAIVADWLRCAPLSVIAVITGIAIISVIRGIGVIAGISVVEAVWWGRGGDPAKCAGGSADRRAHRRAWSATGRTPDRRAGSGTEQTATDKTLPGIVRIGAGRQTQDQREASHAYFDGALHGSAPFKEDGRQINASRRGRIPTAQGRTEPPYWGVGRRRSGLDLLPVRVGVEAVDRRSERGGLRPEVLLVDHAIVIDDERHHAGIAPTRRPGNQPEAANHPAVDNEIGGTPRRVRALAGQELEVIPVIGGGLLRGGRPSIARGAGGCHQRAERALRLPFLGGPIEAVYLAGAAQNMLGVFRRPAA